LGGTIDSTFLDGCYSGVSAQAVPEKDPTGHIITMMHSLVRLQSMDVVYKYSPNIPHDSSQAGPQHNWFWKWSANAPRLKLYNNVFRVDGSRTGGPGDYLVPSQDMFYDAASCENNQIVWLGSGSFPEPLPFPTQQNPPCFTVTTDVTIWNNAATDWQNKHGAPSGAAKPIVSIFPARQPYYWPSPTQPFRGTMPAIATAVDDRAISSVRFQIDNKDIGTVTQAAAIGDGSTGPTKYNLSWDSRYYADATLVANGSHTLKAIARDDQNQETTSTGVPVTVSNPVASFTFSCTQLACSFTSTSTDPNGTIASYAWTFGDGGTSTVQNPSHSYTASGTYTVTLTVTGNGGAASAPKSLPVTVSAPPPPPLAPPTNCSIQRQPPTGTPVYLKVSWTNGDPSASTEVWIQRNGIWTYQSTEAPGISAYYYSMGYPPQTGLFYGQVRHVKAGYPSSPYCVTGSTAWPP
jgi:PKD repeat protein